MMVVPGTVERALINRGLLKATITKRGEISFSRITPAGLRALADAMAAGRVEDALVRMKRESVSRRRQAKRRAHGR
jgi:hypothetical protein